MTSINITTTKNTVVVDESGDIAVVTVKTAGVNGAGTAPGGTTGQLLVKDSAATYDTSWTSQPTLSGAVFDPSIATSFSQRLAKLVGVQSMTVLLFSVMLQSLKSLGKTPMFM